MRTPYLFTLMLAVTALAAVAVEPVPQAAAKTAVGPKAPPPTPTGFPGAQAFVYRDLSPVPLRLHVVKPTGWTRTDRRPALVFFFGGGWERGSTEHSIGWARWAASLGMVGIAPDYRTKERFGNSPLECVADGRAALRWIEEHADELGIDRERIVVGGTSSGGHVALWTAITKSPPGSDPKEAPLVKPVALVLSSPVSDTSPSTGYTPRRFGEHALDLSAFHQLDPRMPPVLLFHGDADKVVPQRQSLALRDKLRADGDVCQFVNVPGGSHNFATDLPEWREKSHALIQAFLEQQHVLPVTAGSR